MPRCIKPAKALRLKAEPSDLARFMAKVTFRRFGAVRTLCWEWDANADEKGYGKFKFRSRQLWAHRASYAMFRGPIKEGLEVDHRCHNPRCVNPHHLRPKTRAKNIGESNTRRAALA